MTSEPEGRAASTAMTEAVGGTTDVAATGESANAPVVTAGSTASSDESAAAPAAVASAGTTAGTAMTATAHAATAAAETRDTTPPLSPPDGARVSNSLETVKTAVVWLVVIQLLTILSPLLRVSLKWTLVVGVVLVLSSFALGVVAYVKAQRAQRALPE